MGEGGAEGGDAAGDLPFRCSVGTPKSPCQDREHAMSVMPAAASGVLSGSKYDRLIALAKGVPTVSTIVAHPCDESSLRGAIESAEAGIIKAILVGHAARIRDVAAKHGLNVSGYEIVDPPPTEAAAAARGVEPIHESKGAVPVKGSLHTDEIMPA